jgi:hypothetical protein
MPAYGAPTCALYPGTPVPVVNNAATDSGITTTQAVAVAPAGTSGGETVMIQNTTNQNATGQWSSTDISANYQPLSGCVIPAGSVLPYNISGGWLRFTFSVAPTSGSLILAR